MFSEGLNYISCSNVIAGMSDSTKHALYCYSGTRGASSGDVRFDPDQVISQLNVVDEDLLSDDDFFSDTSNEGISGCG